MSVNYIIYLRDIDRHRHARFHGAAAGRTIAGTPRRGGERRSEAEFPLVFTLGVVFGRAAPKKGAPSRTRPHKTLALIHVRSRNPPSGGKEKTRVAHNGSEPPLLVFDRSSPLYADNDDGAVRCGVCERARVPLGISEIYIPVRPIVGRRMAGIS